LQRALLQAAAATQRTPGVRREHAPVPTLTPAPTRPSVAAAAGATADADAAARMLPSDGADAPELRAPNHGQPAAFAGWATGVRNGAAAGGAGGGGAGGGAAGGGAAGGGAARRKVLPASAAEMQEATSRWSVCYEASDELHALTDGDVECIICLSEMEAGEELVKLPCSEAAKAHVFHHDCLKRWLLCSAACPTCRRGVRPMLKAGPAAPAPANRPQAVARGRRAGR
jgi:hypothetical protein